MKYIGLSLGGCLRSIMAGEVSENDVMFIVTRTMAPTFAKYIYVVETYHKQGNHYSRDPNRYELGFYSLDQVTDLATRLWNAGKIHQPRVFVEEGFGGTYHHPAEFNNEVWLEIAPSNSNSTPAVVEAYTKYKMLDSLTK